MEEKRNYITKEHYQKCVKEADEIIIQAAQKMKGTTPSHLEEVLELVPARFKKMVNDITNEKVMNQTIEAFVEAVISLDQKY